MLQISLARLKQGHRTIAYPGGGADIARPLSRPAGHRRVEVPGRLPRLRRGVPDGRHHD